MAAIDDFKQFVKDAEHGTQFASWARDNCGKNAGGTPTSPTPTSELGKWFAFRDAILAGKSPPPPTMLTDHGRELIDEAVETEHYRALEQQTPYIVELGGTAKAAQKVTLTIKEGRP